MGDLLGFNDLYGYLYYGMYGDSMILYPHFSQYMDMLCDLYGYLLGFND